ncbi:hypothetical protein [Acaryochloris sp. IP29b_bin.148]|uniref:hypothetical protein n=1 Tax=Acaryochloris sp. IP29b_bin.148 TaxID=2969218 RepID=UPI0026070365|nr:hypothetical protein [Acaryochloris sp. IP29b_bin.148]
MFANDDLQSSAALCQLRHAAAQGCPEAMAQLLNHALAHKQIDAEVWVDELDLHVYLQASISPDEKSAVMLCSREVEQWSLSGIETLWISGQEVQAQEASWCWQLSLTGADEHMPTVQQAARGTLWQRPVVSQVVFGQTEALDSLSWVPQTIDRAGWNAIAAGCGLAFLVLASQQVTFLLSPLITLVHELGHTLTNWIFGYPAIPAFDFMHGGGVTVQTSRMPFLIGLIYGGFGCLFYIYWNNYLTARVLLGVVMAYTLCAFTGIHEFLVVSMGHGFELLFVGIFLVRAISGYGCRYAIERPLYAMLAAYMTIYDLQFSWRLMFDSAARALYEQGKGGVIDHDLVRIARDVFQVDLTATASIMLLATMLTPLMAWGMYRYWPWIVYGINRLFRIKVARS